MEAVIPHTFVGPKVTFKGMEDLEAHLTAFHTQMMLVGGSDAVRCKLFMSTLTRMAMDWFVSLLNGHITSFAQLSQLFREQYIANWAPPPVSYDLFNVKQYQGETLKEYINRFGAQVVKVGTTEEPMIVYAFRKGMCPGPFCESIIRSRPRTFAEIRRRAMEHIATEGEVCEKRTSVASARPRASSRAQPARVNEAATGRKSQDRKRPYEARRPQARGRAEGNRPVREGNRPLRHNFVVELKDLLAVPNIADRLRPPVKTDKELGPHKDSWEIQYPEWLANVVLVKKVNGKWRICIDFTDLNKACPKDSYPLPSINALVDSASGCKMLSFLDAFSGYNRIKMHPRDESKTAFMTETCSYCYKVMPFGLKNAGTTYQRLMDRVLAPMLGRNVQAYVDDMVVTSQERGRHTADLEELFATIAKYRLKLNPEKCVFGVEAGKFLGFMLTERGIEANRDKCAAIIAMRIPASIKEVQQLTRRMAALSRFVSAGGDKGHPYFQCLKRNSRFVWTEECETAFLRLKEYLATPLVLCKPRAGEPLRLYFVVTEWAISFVLVQEQDQVQRPIYFVSKALQGPETRYQLLEKAALAVVFSARRLRHYFHSFTVVVMTDLPIQKVLQKPDVAGRMLRWAVELSEFDIVYEPRGSIKGQVYADFVAELTPGGVTQEVELGSQWMLSIDGSSNQQGSGAGIVLEGPNGVLIEQALRFAFKASNNQAEYEALIAGMLLAKEMGAQSLLAKSDSQLVTRQVTGEYQVKDPQMAVYLRYVQVLKGAFAAFELVHVSREQNARADLLAKLANSGKGGRQRTVIQETLKTLRKFVADNRVDVLHISTTRGKPRSHQSLIQDMARVPGVSVYAASPEEEGRVQVYALEEGDTWMTPYRRYIADRILPAEPGEGKRIKRNSARYTLIDEALFRHGFTHLILTCVSGDECTKIMSELHEGICGSHVGGRSLASKVIRAGFYWPSVREDCVRYAQRCKQCQMHVDWHKAPPEELRSMYSPWPFHTWGIDILGPFPLAIRQMKYLIVAIEYFTKWVEAEPVAQIDAHKVQHFV
ncbi:uncharacterized protein [Phaseolus vulgaris]|uniref:uncharacterized protein n=1 Tax=Phaseolus vulgaris TaxID=3885 RepID=UPI0035CBE483